MIIGGVVVGGIHVLAVVVVLGSSFFINMVLSRITPTLAQPEVGKLNAGIGANFTPVVWVTIILIALTGLARAAFLKVLNPEVLFKTVYGNLLVGKIIILAIIIINTILITQTGLSMKAMSKDGPPPPDAAAAAGARIKMLGTSSMVLGMIAVIFAVAMRFIGAPE